MFFSSHTGKFNESIQLWCSTWNQKSCIRMYTHFFRSIQCVGITLRYVWGIENGSKLEKDNGGYNLLQITTRLITIEMTYNSILTDFHFFDEMGESTNPRWSVLWHQMRIRLNDMQLKVSDIKLHLNIEPIEWVWSALQEYSISYDVEHCFCSIYFANCNFYLCER